MKITSRKVSLVGMAIMTAFVLLSVSGFGYTWSTQHTRAYWSVDQPVANDVLDAVQTADVYNGNGMQILSEVRTGGTWQYPTEIHTAGHEDEYLIFHSKVSIYLYWGDGTPSRPDNCWGIYGQASLELQKLVGFNWISVGGTTGTHSTQTYIRTTEGTTLETDYLHVWNDTTSLGNMDLYRLVIYSVGGWIDTGMVSHPDNSPVTDYGYYRINVP